MKDLNQVLKCVSIQFEGDRQPVKYRMVKFLSTISEDAIRIHNSKVLEQSENKDDLDCVLKEFEKFAIGERNII